MGRNGNGNFFPVERVVESEEFPYVVGVLQARVRAISLDRYAVTDQDSWPINLTRRILEETLQTPVYDEEVEYKKEVTKVKRRLVVWNRAFMEFLMEQTQNNARVASFVLSSRKKRRNFIRGFFDSRGSVSYSTYHVKRYDYDIRFPRIVLTRFNDGQLLDSFADVLEKEHIEPTIGAQTLRIQRQSDIGRILRRKLITAPIKLNMLENLYEELREYQRIA